MFEEFIISKDENRKGEIKKKEERWREDEDEGMGEDEKRKNDDEEIKRVESKRIGEDMKDLRDIE